MRNKQQITKSVSVHVGTRTAVPAERGHLHEKCGSQRAVFLTAHLPNISSVLFFPPWCCRNHVEGPSGIAHSHLRRALQHEAERPGTLPSAWSPPTHTQTHSNICINGDKLLLPYLQKRRRRPRSLGETSGEVRVFIDYPKKV